MSLSIKPINFLGYLPLLTLKLVAMGCQNTPAASTSTSTEVKGNTPLVDTASTGAVMESSYLCQGAQGDNAMISVFYDSRSQTTAPATLRINESDYAMSLLSAADNTAYISQQQNEKGQRLFWQVAKEQPNIAQLSIVDTDMKGLNVLYQCKVTR